MCSRNSCSACRRDLGIPSGSSWYRNPKSSSSSPEPHTLERSSDHSWQRVLHKPEHSWQPEPHKRAHSWQPELHKREHSLYDSNDSQEHSNWREHSSYRSMAA